MLARPLATQDSRPVRASAASRLRRARLALWSVRAPARSRADVVVPEGSLVRAVVLTAIAVFAVIVMTALPDLPRRIPNVALLRWGFVLVAPIVAGLEILAWWRHRSVQLRRFAAVVKSVRSVEITKGRWRRVRRNHEAVLVAGRLGRRRYAVDAAVMRHLVEGDVGVAFVRAGRLVGFTPIRDDEADGDVGGDEHGGL